MLYKVVPASNEEENYEVQ